MAKIQKIFERHGLKDHPLYAAWSGIVQRCTNPNNPMYKYYGGKGITICNEWRMSFVAFYNWCMDNKWESGLEVDKDTKGGNIYSPENCILITKKKNCNHRRTNHYIEYKGQIKTIQEWSDLFEINSGDLRYRLRINDWDLEKALSFIPRKQKRKNQQHV